MNYAELDDGYYYILSSELNEELAAEQAREIVLFNLVALKNLPNRPAIILVEPDFPDNKLIIVWEFGVIGEVKIYPELDS